MKAGDLHDRERILDNFTLVELLVVIAIIAILAGILLPALNVVKERVRSIACSNNMMTAGKSLMFYADDYNDLLPEESSSLFSNGCAVTSAGTVNIMYGYWPKEVSAASIFATFWELPSLTKPIISKYVCPSAKSGPDAPEWATNFQYRTMGYNLEFTYGIDYRKRTRFRFPSILLVLGDSNARKVSWANTPASYHMKLKMRHNGMRGTNVLFGDGHIKMLLEQEVPNDAAYYKKGFWNPLSTTPAVR